MEFLKKLFYFLIGIAFIAFIAWLVFPGFSTLGTGPHRPILQWFNEDILGIPKCGIFGGGCSNNGGAGTVNSGGVTTNIQIVNPNIHTSNLAPSAVLQNSFVVKGEARYSWFYQGVALGKVLDENGAEIGAFQIRALTSASANTFVPFSGQIFFNNPSTKTGYVIFDRANPTNDPAKRSKLYVPIVFSGAGAGNNPISSHFTQPVYKACRVTGCSGEICSDKEVMSNCVYKPEYACYKEARCEVQADGNCGFTMTSSINACVANSQGAGNGSGGGLQGPTH